MLPDRVGPYRVVGQLGSGGMGVVYRGVDETGQEVAIKTVRGARQSLLAAIRREIRALMRVRHPGVVRVFAEGVSGGLPWYAMELLVGGTLRDHHQQMWGDAAAKDGTAPTSNRKHSPVQETVVERPRRPTPPGEVPQPTHGRRRAGAGHLGTALRPIARLCQTLAFLHGEGIVHRDLKPDNVFLTGRGQPVLMDFGIATLLGGGAREVLDPSAGLSGTVGYMAPEQILGERTDARADLYSVGCLLYELVTGLSAFGGPTQEVVSHHVHSEPIRPSELVDGLPGALEELVLRLMAKRPRDRIGHADDVVAGLEEWTGKLEPPVSDTGARLEPRVYLYRPDLVGRQEIREQLTGKLAGAVDGAGGLVHLGGESGVGKTALATELMRQAAQIGFTVIAGECQAKVDAADDGGGALHPLRPFLQGVADRCLERGAEATRRLLGARAALLAAFEPALLPLAAGVPKPHELPPDAARQRLFQALGETIAAFSEERGLLLVLDDLQWADELTVGFLATLEPEWLAGRRLLVCATHRSDEVSPELRRALEVPAAERFELGRLDARTIEAMVGGMLALPAPPRDIVDFLYGASEGNPFFVAEYLRAAAGEGLLARDGGRWRLAKQSAGGFRLDTPRGLRELVGDRVDRLPAGARELVDAAAVLGREVAMDILLETAGKAEHDAAASHALSELLLRNVLEIDGSNVRFVHDKLREVAYDKLVEVRRKSLHAAAGHSLESRLARTTDPATLYPTLAHHFDVAGLRPQALDYLEKSGSHALATSAHAAASDAYSRALVLASSENGNVEPRRLARWKHGLAKAQFALGNLDHAETHARAALAGLGRPLPESKGGWTKLLLVEALRQTWRVIGPQGTDERLPQNQAEDLAEAAQLAGLLTHRYYYVGDAASMIGASLLSVNLAERVDAGQEVPHAYAWLGYAVGLLRRHELAQRYFELAYAGADKAGDVLAKSFAVNVEAVYHIGFGAFDIAAMRAGMALELADGDAQSRELATNVLGHVDFYSGRLDDSLRRYSAMLASARKRHNQQHVTWGLFTQGRAMCAQGRYGEALPLLREARQRLVDKPERDSEIIVLGLLAHAEAMAGDASASREAVRGVLERIRGSKPGGFSVIDGYDGGGSALIALARKHGIDSELDTGARELVAAMQRLSRLFPMVGPYAALHRGELDALRGRERQAEKAFVSARHLADEMGMHGLRLRAEAALERPRA